MASSDDEEEVVPHFVMGYYLVDENESPIPFSVLPIHFDDSENQDTTRKQVFLHGTVDDGLQKVFKQVTAWKLGLQDDQPEVTVLSKDKKWIKLLKPRKSYEESIRSLLITIQMLHFLENNPEASEKSLWDHLRKVFSTFEILPSEDDLKDHLSLIKLFHEHDKNLAKSELLLTYLKGKHRSKASSEVSKKDIDLKQSFIIEDDEVDEGSGDNGDESEEESDLFDSVCAICDNGGEILCCEGRCMRSFHATKDAGIESACKSLGYTQGQVEAIQNFLCKNCLYKQHQCFACGKLGSSDKSAGAEVFPCVNATCGHFYHPKCVAELLFPNNEIEASEYEKKIAAGESFTCPVHKCVVCKQGENKEVHDLQFAVCRRCPKSYHRKCLPRKIAFDDIEEEGIIQRAWEDLLPKRILIYCLKHKIDEDLRTPIRNHIIFPEGPEKKKAMNVQKRNFKAVVKKRVHISDNFSKDLSCSKPSNVIAKPSSLEQSDFQGKSARSVNEQVPESWKKVKPQMDSTQPDSCKADDHSVPEVSKISKEEKPKAPLPTISSVSVGEKLSSFSSSFPVIDGETLKRVRAVMEKASFTLTLEDIIKKRMVPSTHSYTARHIDKSITHGKVEGSCEAMRTALQKLEDGSNSEDAIVVCEPKIVKQIVKWNNKLRVYLSPFLYGMRYTSFGRHFTKVDKLKEIAHKLQWYVQNGDTIVDFCCGANDFSWVMKEKLDAAGKKCSFKNFDLIQPKNDFAFEKRDWMKVHPRELPTGSQLIMGLNPPFGVKGALANKFIHKALTFKPKLLILIVPRETERLDKKKTPYDLIWEDEKFLSGKSFYLPGSVDVDDKQMEQWNLNPPPLYLWSRSDWTVKHKIIAMKHGHTSMAQHDCVMEDAHIEKPMDAHNEENEGGREGKKILEYGNQRESPKENVDGREGNKEIEYGNKRRSRENDKRQSQEIRKLKKKAESLERKMEDTFSDMSISPPRRTESRHELEPYHPSGAYQAPSDRAINHLSGMDFGMGSGNEWNSSAYEEVDEIARRYTPNGAAINRSSSRVSNIDYGGSSEEQFQSYVRESSADTFARKPHISDYDDYGMPSRLYGLQGQDLAPRNRFSLGGSDSSLGRGDTYPLSTYGRRNPTVGFSAMQRYAPCLDETNYVRGGPHPGTSGGMYDMPRVQRDFPPNFSGFAPGPQHPFPHQGSSGWLDD